ncbi:MAG: response regulator [Nitrospirae bacterium]|nr:response regulator [Nitrospirota bacterium]
MTGEKKILVVDDDDLIRELICHFLARSSFEAHSVNDGPEAIEFLEKRHFDIIITDYSMPRMDGLEFTRIVRDRYPRTAVIGMSAFETVEHDFLEAGAHAFFQKPFFLRDMLSVINSVHVP